MSECDKILERVWDYLDRETNADGLAEIKKHLDLCRPCFSRIEFQKILREKMRSHTHHVCPEKLKQRIKSIIELY